MKRFTIILAAILIFGGTIAIAQSERKAIRQGNREFKKGEFLDSEISYRSALDNNPSSIKGSFNLGGALYKQDKFEESTQIFDNLANINLDPTTKAKIFHNLGNNYFSQEKFEESVEAYKNALRNNPSDMETKYNLAQAQRMLAQQQQQQDSQNNNEDKQDQNKDQDKEDNKDQQDKQNEDKNQQDQQDQQQQQKEQQISPEDARRMLEAIQNNEQKIQEKVREEQARQAKVKVEKNW